MKQGVPFAQIGRRFAQIGRRFAQIGRLFAQNIWPRCRDPKSPRGKTNFAENIKNYFSVERAKQQREQTWQLGRRLGNF